MITTEPWIEEIRLPVLKELVVKITTAHYGDPICLEELGYPVKEVTLETLGYTPFCVYEPYHVFYHQGIQPLKNMDAVSGYCHVYWNGTIVLFARVWKFDYNKNSRYAQPQNSKARNDMIIRAWLIKACEHDYKTTLSRMCYREFKCAKCGHFYAEDSSD